MELINKVIAFVCSVTVFSSTLLGGGLLWSDNDLAVWRDRAVNGPYKSAGDSFDPLIPGEWDRIVTNKNKFAADPTADRVSSYWTTNPPSYTFIPNHIEMSDAAFYSLVKQDSALAIVVKDELMWHANAAGMQISPTYYQWTDGGTWSRAEWTARMLQCADYVKDQFSAGERTTFDAWISDWAYSYEYSIHKELSDTLWGDRYDRSYTTNLGSTATTPNYDGHSYMDSNGINQWRCGSANRWYNNRRASCMHLVGLTSVWLNDAVLKDRAKLFFEEWIQFNIFPDGSTAEFTRNSSSSPNTGLNYLATSLQAAISVAEALRLSGDSSLYDYSSSNGHWESACTTQPPKTIKLVVETFIKLISKDLAWYVDSTSVNESYRIDNTRSGKCYIGEITFATLGNRYWKDDYIKQGYMHDLAGSIAYFTPLGTAGPIHIWGGNEGQFPSCLFMFAEMENVGTGSVTPPVTPPTGPVYPQGYREATVGGQLVFGLDPAWSAGREFEAVFDGDASTFYDYKNGDETFVGIDLGESTLVQALHYHPRIGLENRMVGGRFEGSNESSVSGYETIYVIATEPSAAAQVINLDPAAAYRYYRYLSPANGFGNIAEFSLELQVVVADTDNLPDEWEIQYFGGINAVNGAEAEDFDGDGSSNYDEWLAGTDPSNATDFPVVTPPVTDGLLSNTEWQNLSIELQAGQFSAEYDVVPNVSNMNGTTGLSLGNAATWDDLAVIVGFSEAGQLNARNGGVYTADAVVPYSAGTSYHFRIVGDIPAHTYSVYVTEGAGAEIQLANNYAFRSNQAAVSSLDTLAVVAVTGSHTVSNFTISASVALDTIAPSVPVGLSASAVSTTQINLTWTASSDAVGVAGYTIYREGAEIASTDTSSYSDVGLSASSSYAYSLAAYDAAGNYSSQSAAVSATTAPEVDSDNLPDDWEIQYFGGINAVNGAEAEDFDGDGSSNYDEWLAGTDPSNATDFPVVTPPVTDGLLSNTEWQNLSIELQAGQFSAEYDVVPNVSNMNGTTGLSLGNAATWDDLAVIVGFSEAGQLNARNGGVYTADAVVPYSAGTSYHFRIVGDIPAHTYSVYVTEGAGAEIQLANNYAFRSNQAAVSSLDTLAVVAVTGSHTVSNFTISASVALDTIAPSVPVGLSASAVSTTQINLTWSASSDAVGVAGYTIYREGVEVGSTESSSYSDVGLSASSTYAYSLAAYDAAGNYSSQSAAVSATTAPEVDSDNLPDDWEIQYFGGINAVNGAEAEDFDGDGSSNYDEWLAGTDPSDATDLLELRPVVGVAWASVRDRSYEIDYSDNNWKTFITSETLLGGGGPMVWIDPSDGTLIHKRQYRVQVVAQ